MVCPKCGRENAAGSALCDNCGMDLLLYGKVCKISDKLYNKGLRQARESDLSGAIESLTKSVEFNRHNIQARNLLGLLYYDVGRLGDAAKQWVISTSQNAYENPARRYLDKIDNDTRTREKYNDSIRMYNQALVYLRQKSDDIAMIQLKKAVDNNPRFIDALNLLALCYLIQRDKEHAKALVERVIDMDCSNSTALHYYNEITQISFRQALRQNDAKRLASLTGRKREPKERSAPPNGDLSVGARVAGGIFSFLAGIAAAAVIIYILVIPDIMLDKDEEIANLNAKLETLAQGHSTVERNYQAEIEALTAEKDQLVNDMTESQRRFQDENYALRITAAEWLVGNSHFMEAENILQPIEAARLPVMYLSSYNSMMEAIKPAAASTFKQWGDAAYNQQNYNEAMDYLNRALPYTDDGTDAMAALLYSLGIVTNDMEDYERALSYFEKLAAEYPNYRPNTVTQAIANINAALGRE
jgi:tetratricopeptide (TPR) repeat protein